jgi:hypothetical protein
MAISPYPVMRAILALSKAGQASVGMKPALAPAFTG